MFQNLPKFNQESHIHFITAKTFENHPFFKNEKCCLILLEELDFYRKKLGFKILGYVIMLDHFHCLIFWDIEKYKELTISKIMQGVKSHSAKEISYFLQTGRRKPSLSPYSKCASEGSHLPNNNWNENLHLPNGYKWKNIGKVHTKSKIQIWQKSFYDFNIYTYKKFKEKLNYIHNNPWKANLVKNAEDYKWSSYNFLEKDEGILKIDKIEI